MTTQDFTVAHDGRTTSGVKYFPACGRFPVVVFAHGYNGEARDFAPFAEFLVKNGIGAVIFTFSGGSTRDESGFLTTDMTLSTEQEDLVAVMGEAQKMAGAEALFLFGGSQGGFVSALVAEQHGEEIAGLMLLYPAFCIPDGDPRNARTVGHDAGEGVFSRGVRAFAPVVFLQRPRAHSARR